jgi:hypothetical protein
VLEASRAVASRKSSWFTVSRRQDGIVVYEPNPGAVITHAGSIEVLELGLQIADGRTWPVLVLMQDVARVERGAREFFASEQYFQLASQTALVVGSPVSRVIGSFFLGLNRVRYPCKVFDDEARAVAWLQGYVR